MIRLVHFSDLHIGVDTTGPMNATYRINDRVLDYFDSIDAVIEFAEENKANLAIIAGDTFHKHNPDPTYLSMFAERLSRLSKLCTVVLLVGNHDMPGYVERATAVGVFGALKLPNVIVANKFSMHKLMIEGEALQIATVPYPFKHRVMSSKEFQGVTPEGARLVQKNKISKILRALAKKVTGKAILVGHFSVDTAWHSAEHLYTFGDEADVSLKDVANPVWKYVALGHIHGYQNLTAGRVDVPPVIYSGSIERVDFGEEKESKGFVWVEIGDDAHYEFVELDARKYKTISIDVPTVRSAMKFVLGQLYKVDVKGKIVRVNITVDNPKRIVVADVYDALKEAYTVKAVNVKSTTTVVTPRLGESVIGVTNHELLRRYFEDKDIHGKKLDRLMALGAEIMQEVEDERRS